MITNYREKTYKIKSRKKQSIKLILAFILFQLLIIGITILLCK